MKLKLYNVKDPEFKEYGQILSGYELAPFLESLSSTPLGEGVEYVASHKPLESGEIFDELQNRYYGGMPMQIGYCNGVNSRLNCLEYHRDSEVDIAGTDCILLLARQQDVQDGKLDTSSVKAFFQPEGTAVELFATTLHYAPCSAAKDAGFRVGIVLPLGTNTEKPDYKAQNYEDTLMTAKNKWLLAHPDSIEAKSGAVVALTGENIDLETALW